MRGSSKGIAPLHAMSGTSEKFLWIICAAERHVRKLKERKVSQGDLRDM